jgi:hypothetical protein
VIDFEDSTEDPADEIQADWFSLKPVSQPGDLWQLGLHRLLCGDTRDTANLDHLLGNEQAATGFLELRARSCKSAEYFRLTPSPKALPGGARLRRGCLVDLLSAQPFEATTLGGKSDKESEQVLTLMVMARLQRVGREMRMLVENTDDQTMADPGLLRIVARAHDIQERLMQNNDLTVHGIASQERVSANCLSPSTSSHAAARHHHSHRQRQEPAATHGEEVDATDTADTGRLG